MKKLFKKISVNQRNQSYPLQKLFFLFSFLEIRLTTVMWNLQPFIKIKRNKKISAIITFFSSKCRLVNVVATSLPFFGISILCLLAVCQLSVFFYQNYLPEYRRNPSKFLTKKKIFFTSFFFSDKLSIYLHNFLVYLCDFFFSDCKVIFTVKAPIFEIFKFEANSRETFKNHFKIILYKA